MLVRLCNNIRSLDTFSSAKKWNRFISNPPVSLKNKYHRTSQQKTPVGTVPDYDFWRGCGTDVMEAHRYRV